MNHQERLELLGALSRAGVTYFKSHDLEIKLGGECQRVSAAPGPLSEAMPAPSAPIQNDEATEKLKGLIETLKMDDSSLLDKIFPAGAGF